MANAEKFNLFYTAGSREERVPTVGASDSRCIADRSTMMSSVSMRMPSVSIRVCCSVMCSDYFAGILRGLYEDFALDHHFDALFINTFDHITLTVETSWWPIVSSSSLTLERMSWMVDLHRSTSKVKD